VLRPSVPGGFYFLIFLLSGTYWATCQTLQRCVSHQRHQFRTSYSLFHFCILAPFLLQGLRFVAALRDGRPRAALPVHCVIPDAMDAEPPQSYHPDSSVSKSVDVAVPGNHQTIIFLCSSD